MDPATAIPEIPRRYEPMTREAYLKQVESEAIERYEAEWQRAQAQHAKTPQRIAADVERARTDYDTVIAHCPEQLRGFLDDVTVAGLEFNPVKYIPGERESVLCAAAVESIVEVLRQKGYRVQAIQYSTYKSIYVTRVV